VLGGLGLWRTRARDAWGRSPHVPGRAVRGGLLRLPARAESQEITN